MLKDMFKNLVNNIKNNDDIESEFYDDDSYGMNEMSDDDYSSSSIDFQESKPKKSASYYDIDDSRDFKISNKAVSRNESREDSGIVLNVLKPKHVDDWKLVGDNLKKNNIVLINFEGVPSDVPQRVTDCIFGLCYALEAVARFVNPNIFIVVPKNVKLTGDIQKNINKKLYEVDNETSDYTRMSDVDNLDNMYSK